MKKTLIGLALAAGMVFFLLEGIIAGAPQTKVHKPTGDKIQVESGGEIELKSGAVFDVQSGASITGYLAPSVGSQLPVVDVTVTTPTVAGVQVRTSAYVVYIATNTTGVNGWAKVGAQ